MPPRETESACASRPPSDTTSRQLIHRRLSLVVACILASWCDQKSAAADADPPSSTTLTEVVVTATKREESLQNVPLSITALSAQTLERAGIETFEDYAQKIPNLTFASGLGIMDARQVAIRGVQGVDTTGFYIDDLPIPATMDPRVVDLQRIEVLRGPQGTLYGATSMGGTIRMITQAPDPNDSSGQVHVLGSRVFQGGGGYQTDAMVNIPLIEHQAALRLSAFSGNDGTFINRVFPNPADPAELTSVKVARDDFYGGMASILWKPTDDLTIRPLLMVQSSSLNGFPLADKTAESLLQLRSFDIEEPASDRWTYGGISVKYASPIGDLVSASSWFSRHVYEDEDISEWTAAVLGTPLLPSTIQTWKPQHSFVEELRFASRFNAPIQFTGGIYVQRQAGDYNQNSTVPGLNAASGGIFGTNLLYADYGPGKDNEDAAFGELTYNINSQWSVTGGLRYSKITVGQYFYSTGIAASGAMIPGSTETEHDVNPKAVIRYETSEDLTFYALAAKGFRPGDGQMAPPSTFCGADYAADGLTPQDLASYKADSLWNYEIGAKSRLFDRRVTLDTALFWIDWKNLQQLQRFTCGYDFTVNAGAARSRGGEIELSAIPVDQLQLTAGVGYTDAKITATSPELLTPVGEPVQQIAPWTVNMSADYSFPVWRSYEGFVRADASYTDHSFSANNDPVNLRLRPAYDIENIRTGMRTRQWDIAAFVDNIRDTHANLGDNQSQGGEDPGRPRILVNRPRTIGIEATMRW
jgi:iron complex outermembrane recepter protein